MPTPPPPTSPSFHGQVAIVTGAGTGIGFEIARRLAERGAAVLLNDVDPVLAEETAKRIGDNCVPMAGDAGEQAVIEALVAEAVRRFGRLDIAVANAGMTTFGGFLDYEPAQFQRLVSLNLYGTFFLAQAAARQFVRQQSPGRLLFMSSVVGVQAHPNLAAYGMTKAALRMLARSLAVELAPQRITVNAVAPGATLTERTLELDPDYETTWRRITPTDRVATTADIAYAALFLLAPEAAHITGQTIIVDGGWTAVSPPP